MQKVLDWMGNEVRAGMEVCYVETNFHQPYMSVILGGEKHEQQKSDTPIWLRGAYQKVETWKDGRLYINQKFNANGWEYNNVIFLGDKNIFIDDSLKLAIKGVSDNEPNKIIISV